MTAHHKWTDAEDRRLRSLVGLGIAELCRQFAPITLNQIRGRVWRLGLKIPRRPIRTYGRRGKTPIPPHAHPLVKELIREANKQKCFLYEVADRAGISKTAMSQWRYVRNPSLVMLIAAFNVLGKDLAVVHRHEDNDADLVESVEYSGRNLSGTQQPVMPSLGITG